MRPRLAASFISTHTHCQNLKHVKGLAAPFPSIFYLNHHWNEDATPRELREGKKKKKKNQIKSTTLFVFQRGDGLYHQHCFKYISTAFGGVLLQKRNTRTCHLRARRSPEAMYERDEMGVGKNFGFCFWDEMNVWEDCCPKHWLSVQFLEGDCGGCAAILLESVLFPLATSCLFLHPACLLDGWK